MRKSRNFIHFSDEFQKEKNWEWRKKKTEEPFTPSLSGYDDFQVTGAINNYANLPLPFDYLISHKTKWETAKQM